MHEVVEQCGGRHFFKTNLLFTQRSTWDRDFPRHGVSRHLWHGNGTRLPFRTRVLGVPVACPRRSGGVPQPFPMRAIGVPDACPTRSALITSAKVEHSLVIRSLRAGERHRNGYGTPSERLRFSLGPSSRVAGVPHACPRRSAHVSQAFSTRAPPVL